VLKRIKYLCLVHAKAPCTEPKVGETDTVHMTMPQYNPSHNTNCNQMVTQITSQMSWNSGQIWFWLFWFFLHMSCSFETADFWAKKDVRNFGTLVLCKSYHLTLTQDFWPLVSYHQTTTPRPLIHRLKPFGKWLQICEDIQQSTAVSMIPLSRQFKWNCCAFGPHIQEALADSAM
jgi:hypothetical protein